MNIPELFGSMVFGDAAMRERLPSDAYEAVRAAVERGQKLTPEVADAVAIAMKDWAIEKGATHFTHWFQPMTGVTAEKHDSFIAPDGRGGAIMAFGGKALVKGEPDASSLPSGGLRATFEARGYTAWDPTSYAFIKDGSLCIPTAFCSYSGEALDKKTPILRSMEAIDRQAVRILRLLGDTTVSRVIPQTGPEQEYFLIDRDVYLKRPDLIYTGRTLFGARPPKGQEMEDHYFGVINQRVSAFMKELDEELWKLGVFAKTKHNETAPGQHELASIYSTANVATDHNQLAMELMKSVANKHGLCALLHEKPFAGVNGNGKHLNWSLATDRGVNLLDPGETPHQNAQFLLFLCAVIEAVDEYQDLLRVSVASAGNDLRFGMNEAPPTVISIFLGEELTEILDAIESGALYAGRGVTLMDGAQVLPHIPKDTTDRNRTSPFAFTGNKFEFRMPGSSVSSGCPTYVINTIVAEALSRFADELEASGDPAQALPGVIKRSIAAHKRILFSGNGYDEAWVHEAAQRGLSNLKNTPEALEKFVDPKNIAVLEKHKVLSAQEIHSRYEILLENYAKIIHIEALTMIDMVNREIVPAVIGCQRELSELVARKQALNGSTSIMRFSSALEDRLLKDISALSEEMMTRLDHLAQQTGSVRNGRGTLELAKGYRAHVVTAMAMLRETADALEACVGHKYWTLPSYAEMLYSVN